MSETLPGGRLPPSTDDSVPKKWLLFLDQPVGETERDLEHNGSEKKQLSEDSSDCIQDRSHRGKTN